MIIQKKRNFFIQKNIEIIKILFWRNKITAILIYSAFLMNLILWVGLFWLFKNALAKNLVVHYNVFFGIDVILTNNIKDNWFNLFLPSAGSLFFLIISIIMNIFLIFQLDKFGKNQRILSSFITNRSISYISTRILLISAWLLQLILLVYLFSLWLINY